MTINSKKDIHIISRSVLKIFRVLPKLILIESCSLRKSDRSKAWLFSKDHAKAMEILFDQLWKIAKK